MWTLEGWRFIVVVMRLGLIGALSASGVGVISLVLTSLLVCCDMAIGITLVFLLKCSAVGALSGFVLLSSVSVVVAFRPGRFVKGILSLGAKTWMWWLLFDLGGSMKASLEKPNLCVMCRTVVVLSLCVLGSIVSGPLLKWWLAKMLRTRNWACTVEVAGMKVLSTG